MVEFIFSEKDLEAFIKEVEKDPGGKGVAEANSSGNPCMEKVDPEMELAWVTNKNLSNVLLDFKKELLKRLKQVANLQALVEELAKAKEKNEKELVKNEESLKYLSCNFEDLKNRCFWYENLLSEKIYKISFLNTENSMLKTQLGKHKRLNQKIGNLKNNIARLGKENGQLKKELAELKNPQQERKEEGTKEEEKE